MSMTTWKGWRTDKDMKATLTLQVELQPFQTPNFVRVAGKPGLKQEGVQDMQGQCFPLSDLDPETLDRLCRDFRDEVFRKAGKERPPATCWCESCDIKANDGLRSRMSLCPKCGDKRCARAVHHDAEGTTPNAEVTRG